MRRLLALAVLSLVLLAGSCGKDPEGARKPAKPAEPAGQQKPNAGEDVKTGATKPAEGTSPKETKDY